MINLIVALIILSRFVCESVNTPFTACRYQHQTSKEKSSLPTLFAPKLLCKPWDKYFPRPTTKLACESSAAFFYQYLADAVQSHPTEAQLSRILAECTCDSHFITTKLRGSVTLPQASIPKNAAQGGCGQTLQLFEACMKAFFKQQVVETKSLRGSQSQSSDVSHVSKLEQLRNWKKHKRENSPNDPLL